MLDRERLAKVLAMTTSNHDGEALSAIRRANEILAGENLTWTELLGPGALQHVTVTVSRGFAHPEFYAAMEEWTIRQKR